MSATLTFSPPRPSRWAAPRPTSWALVIDTLDEPGWSVTVPLDPADLDRVFDELTVERSASDWLHAWVEDEAFHATCGPRNLTEVIDRFAAWSLG